MNNNRRIMLCGAALATLFGVTSVWADPAPAIAANNSSSGMIALNSLPDAPATLATAKVADAKGLTVGGVQKIVMDANGKPVSVDVSLLGSGAVVAIDAAKFNYDQGHNVLTAELDAQQIAAAPRAPQS